MGIKLIRPGSTIKFKEGDRVKIRKGGRGPDADDTIFGTVIMTPGPNDTVMPVKHDDGRETFWIMRATSKADGS